MSQSDNANQTASYSASEPQIFDIAELLAALWRRKWWVIIPMLTLGTLAAAFSAAMPPRYVASTQILIDPRGLNIIDKEITPSTSNNESQTPIIESQMRVMISDVVLRKVVTQEGLDKDPEFIGERSDLITKIKRWLLSPFASPKVKANPVDTALNVLSKDLGVERPSNTYIVNLYVATQSAQKSARIANAIARVYATSEFTTRKKLSKRATASLTRRLDELRKRVQLAEQNIVAYRKKNNIVGASGLLVHEQQLSQLNTNLINQQGQTAKARARFEQIADLRRRNVPPDAISEAMGSLALRQLQQRLAVVLGTQAPLEAQLGSQHPRLKRARARTAIVRRLLKEELRRIEQSARLDYERSLADEKALQARKDQLTQIVQTNNAAQVQLRELERDAQASRSIYETFLTRSREIAEQQAVDTTVARVLSPAQPPTSKSGPRLILLLAAGIIGGVVLGAMLALLRDQLDQRIFSSKRLRDKIAVPVLTEFGRLSPLVRSVSDAVRNLPRGVGPSEDESPSMSPGVLRILHGAIGTKAGTLLRQLDGQSRTGEVRTVMLHSASDDGEGTSSVALALALKAALNGDAVLLVDGERGARRLSHIFGRDNSAGLVEVLRGVLGAQIAVQSVPEVGIWLLPAGRKTRSQIKSTARRNEWPVHFADAGGYDLVIIDGGTSVNATQRLLTAQADDIVLVVHKGASTYDAVENTGWLLKEHWERVRGTVLIDFEPPAVIAPVKLSAPSAMPTGKSSQTLDLLGRAPRAAAASFVRQKCRAESAVQASGHHRALNKYVGTGDKLRADKITQTLAANEQPIKDANNSASKRSITDLFDQASQARQTGKVMALTATATAIPRPMTRTAPAATTKQNEAPITLPTLANIPVLTTRRPRNGLRPGTQLGQRSNTGFGDMMAALADGNTGNNSPFRKAIAKLLQKVQSKAVKGQTHIVTLVAGHTGAGTSSTALSLAYAAALSGKRTLLVDAYSPDADLSTTFADTLGFNSLGSFQDMDYLKKISIRDNITGLTFLPIALAHLDKFKQHQRDRLALGLGKLSTDYELVIIDGGSILDGTSPSELTTLADQLLIVACPGITLPDTIEATEMVLGSARSRVSGLVMAHAKAG